MLLDEVMAAAKGIATSDTEAVRAQQWRRLKNARWLYSAWKQLPPGAELDDAAHVEAIRGQGELVYLQSIVEAAGLPLTAPEEFVTREPLPWRPTIE